MTAGYGAITDPDRRRNVEPVPSKIEIFLGAKARQTGIDGRAYDVKRRRRFFRQVCPDEVEHLGHRDASGFEVELRKVCLVKKPTSGIRLCEGCGQGLAVVEGQQVLHRRLLGSPTGADQSPVARQPLQYDRPTRRNEIVELQFVPAGIGHDLDLCFALKASEQFYSNLAKPGRSGLVFTLP